MSESREMGDYQLRSRAVNYAVLRKKICRLLAQGPMMHPDLVQAMMAGGAHGDGTNHNSASKAIQYAAEDKEIQRVTNRHPWRLRQREPHTGGQPPPDHAREGT